jgi:chitin disaccharide deacetylase
MTASDASPHGQTTGAGSRPAIRLVVNADDFGISEAVNDGIVMTHRSGIVTATSLMAVGRAFEHAVNWCRHLPSLDVGVHLTLVAERPLRPKPSSLADEGGRFPASVGAFLRRYLLRRIRMADVEAELCAQIERVLDHGLRPTHLDSHQHVHALPGVAQMVLRLSARYGIPFVRAPVEGLRMERPIRPRRVFRLVGATVLRMCWTMVCLSEPVAAKSRRLHFLGFAEGGRLNHDCLQRLLQSLQPGYTYELMCHPGFTPDESDIKQWNYRHEEELLALTSASAHALIAARGIQLCNYKNLTQSTF